MNPTQTSYAVPSFLQPSYCSATGIFIASVRDRERIPFHLNQIQAIALRIINALTIVLASILDAAIWLGHTIVIVRALRIGICHHLANLTSIIAAPIFAILALFGYYPELSYTRSAIGSYIHNFIAAIWARNAQRVAYLAPKVLNTRYNSLDGFLSFAASIPQSRDSITAIIQAGFNPNVSNFLGRSPCSLYHAMRIGCSVNITTLCSQRDLNLENPWLGRETSVLTDFIFARDVRKPKLYNFFHFREVRYINFVNVDLSINESEVARGVRGICDLIRNHAYYSTQDLKEAQEFFRPLCLNFSISFFNRMVLRQNNSNGSNPYIKNYLEGPHPILQRNLNELMVIERTLGIFLAHAKEFENAQREAEGLRAEFLNFYLPRMSNDILLLTSKYWIPNPGRLIPN